MPVMALFRSATVDQSRYDAIIQELDLERRPPEGILTHACGFDANGICVVDVWDSRKALEAFLGDRLRPAFAKLNIDFAEPQIIETYAFSASKTSITIRLNAGRALERRSPMSRVWARRISDCTGLRRSPSAPQLRRLPVH